MLATRRFVVRLSLIAYYCSFFVALFSLTAARFWLSFRSHVEAARVSSPIHNARGSLPSVIISSLRLQAWTITLFLFFGQISASFYYSHPHRSISKLMYDIPVAHFVDYPDMLISLSFAI